MLMWIFFSDWRISFLKVFVFLELGLISPKLLIDLILFFDLKCLFCHKTTRMGFKVIFFIWERSFETRIGLDSFQFLIKGRIIWPFKRLVFVQIIDSIVRCALLAQISIIYTEILKWSFLLHRLHFFLYEILLLVIILKHLLILWIKLLVIRSWLGGVLILGVYFSRKLILLIAVGKIAQANQWICEVRLIVRLVNFAL